MTIDWISVTGRLVTWVLVKELNGVSTPPTTVLTCQVAVITILAFGAMTLIIGGMIDLSAGAVMAFAGVVSVMVYKSTGNLLIAILAGILIGSS